MASEASKELASIVHFGAVIESLGPLAQLKVDGSAAKIDAAVAPLKAALAIAETYVELAYENEGGEEAAQAKQDLDTVRKALDPWRK